MIVLFENQVYSKKTILLSLKEKHQGRQAADVTSCLEERTGEEKGEAVV